MGNFGHICGFYDSSLLCTSFIPFISRWRELDLGHNTLTEMCWTHSRIIGSVRGYMEKLVGSCKATSWECRNSKGVTEYGRRKATEYPINHIQIPHCALILRWLYSCPTNVGCYMHQSDDTD